MNWNSYLNIVYILVGIVGGIILIAGTTWAIVKYIGHGQSTRKEIVGVGAIVSVIIIVVGVIAFILYPKAIELAPGKPPNPTPTATTISSATPTDSPPTSPTTTVSSPPPTTEPSPVPTEPTPQLESAKTLSENFILPCDCSDPIVVTVTKIEIQPQQNRMIWFLTFYNDSQNSADATFRQFYLEKGDQVTYPTSGDQTIYYATGEAVSTGLTLQAGETQQTTLTFSFVPYKAMPYTLTSDLGGLFNGVLAYNVPFKQKVIPL